MARLAGTRLDLNSATATRQAWSDSFNARLQPLLKPFDWSEVERMAEQMADEGTRENRSLGARLIGDECARRVQYEVQHAFWGTIPEREPLDGDSYSNFARGVYGEAWMCNLLCRAGFDIKRTDEDGKPLGFSTARGRIRGNIDGDIRGLPVWLHEWLAAMPVDVRAGDPRVWEHKCVGKKSWQAIYNNGLAKAKPQYADQIAIYQFYMATNWAGDPRPAPALFTAHNADTGQIYAELVEFDPKRCQAAIDRAVMIIKAMEARELLPRVRSDIDGFPCSWNGGGCRFRKACWG